MSQEQLIAQMFVQLKTLTTEVAQLRAVIAGNSRTEGWARPESAAAALQSDGVRDARHLQRLRLDGAFSEVKGEIRNVSTGNRPTWEYHIPKCRTALQRYFKHLAG